MARHVLDVALLLKAIAGYDSIDHRQLGAPRPDAVPNYPQIVLDSREGDVGLKGMMIGVLKEGFEHDALDAGVESVVRKAIKRFEALGAVVEDVSVPT